MQRPARFAHISPGTVGLISLMGVLVSWSFGPTLSTRLTTHPIVSASLRMAGASAVQWLLSVVIKKPPTWAILKQTFIPGALFAVNNVLFFFALQHASVADTTLLVSLQPAVVLLLAKPLFNETVRAWDVGWTAVALGGAAFAILGASSNQTKTPTTALGAFFAIASMLAFCGYFLVSKHQNTREGVAPAHPLTYVTAIVTSAAITMVPILLLSGHVSEISNINTNQMGDLAWVVVVPTIGHLFLMFSHRHVDATVSSLMLLIQPLTSAYVAWWLLGQQVVAAQVVGCAIVIASIGAVTLRRRAPQPAS